MRGSVWVYIQCYLTDRRGKSYAFEKVYGYSEVRDVDTKAQQKIQFHKAINKALAEYRDHNQLDSDVEVNFHLIRDGLTYEGYRGGEKKNLDRKTRLSSYDKTRIRRQVILNQPSDKGMTVTEKDVRKMYDKKITKEEYHSKKYKNNRGDIETQKLYSYNNAQNITRYEYERLRKKKQHRARHRKN